MKHSLFTRNSSSLHSSLRQVGQFSVLALSALSFSACGLIQTHSRDDAALGQVKKVAIVAFSEQEPTSATIGLNLGSGKVEGGAGGTEIPSSEAHVDKMYSELIKSFNEKTHWNVMNQKLMSSNAGYKVAFDKTMKGFQNKMPPNKGERQFLVKDIMDYDSPRILDVSGRDALITALGVDAIVVARVDVMLNGTAIMGIGSRHPQSNLSFFVYKKGVEKPIWFEGQIKGDEMESVGKTAFIDEALLGQLALKSAETAYAKIDQTGTSTNQ